MRVVTFGDVSSEFCGGTHVENSEEIGLFVIEFEESIAAGVRRITARTSVGAYELLKKRESILHQVATLVGANSIHEVNDRIKALVALEKELAEQNNRLIDKLTAITAESLCDTFVLFSGYKVIMKHLANEKREVLTKVGDNLKIHYDDYVIVLAGGQEGDIPLVAFVGGNALKDGIKAGNIIKQLAKELDGSGGGRPEMAQGQGRILANLQKAFDNVKESLK